MAQKKTIVCACTAIWKVAPEGELTGNAWSIKGACDVAENKFPERFRNLIAGKEVSKYKIAHLCGVTYSTVYRWGNGKTEPKGKHYAYIADYFGVSVDFLMGRTDNPETNK